MLGIFENHERPQGGLMLCKIVSRVTREDFYLSKINAVTTVQQIFDARARECAEVEFQIERFCILNVWALCARC